MHVWKIKNCCCGNLVGELIGLIMCVRVDNLVGDGKTGDDDAWEVCVVGAYLERYEVVDTVW